MHAGTNILFRSSTHRWAMMKTASCTENHFVLIHPVYCLLLPEITNLCSRKMYCIIPLLYSTSHKDILRTISLQHNINDLSVSCICTMPQTHLKTHYTKTPSFPYYPVHPCLLIKHRHWWYMLKLILDVISRCMNTRDNKCSILLYQWNYTSISSNDDKDLVSKSKVVFGRHHLLMHYLSHVHMMVLRLED